MLPDTSPPHISEAKKRGLKGKASGRGHRYMPAAKPDGSGALFPSTLPSRCVSAKTWENNSREQAILRLLGRDFSAVITLEASN